MLVMILLRRLRCLSIYGVSIGGAAGHNLGQMAVALITLGNTAVLGYLPFLLGISLLTGTPHGLRLLSAVPGHGPYQTLDKGVIDNG